MWAYSEMYQGFSSLLPAMLRVQFTLGYWFEQRSARSLLRSYWVRREVSRLLIQSRTAAKFSPGPASLP